MRTLKKRLRLLMTIAGGWAEGSSSGREDMRGDGNEERSPYQNNSSDNGKCPGERMQAVNQPLLRDEGILLEKNEMKETKMMEMKR